MRRLRHGVFGVGLIGLIGMIGLIACGAGTPVAPRATPAVASRALAGWAPGAVFYEVFVRSFADSNGDGHGDLKGLIAHLDYLNDGDPATDTDLGVDALWLMPVFASPSYHGYDVTDYETINPQYGSNADFAELLAQAHRRGIRVVIDLVLNHTSAEHPWFVASAASASSPRRDWYVWSATDPGWGQLWDAKGKSWHPRGDAWFYGLFDDGMPDLNYRNPAVRAEVKRIAAAWLARGVDGFRLDAVPHLIETGRDKGQANTPETHELVRELAAYVRSIKPGALLIGEAWQDTPTVATYYGSTERVPGGDELPLNFDFALAEAIGAGVTAGDASGIARKLHEIQATYPPGATDVPFLTNHDQVRIATQLKGDLGKLRCAATLLLTLPGTPFLYYGEELGLQNGNEAEGDRAKRTPMPWDASAGGGFTAGAPWHAFAAGRERANVAVETADPESLLSQYRQLIRLRHGSAALGHGELQILHETGAALVFLRSAADQRVVVAINLGSSPERITVPLAAARARPLYARPGVELVVDGTTARITLPAYGAGVFAVP